jgi:hypothetical protein
MRLGAERPFLSARVNSAKPNCSKALSASAIPRWLVLGQIGECHRPLQDGRSYW